MTKARRLFETWRSDEFGYLKRRILSHAMRYGSVHSDDVSQEALDGHRNMIGAAFNALRGAALIQSTGEHRRSNIASTHGRRSYVYRLTDKGRVFASVMSADREAKLKLKEEPKEIYRQMEFDA